MANKTFINLTGKIFNRWTVIKKSSLIKNRTYYWECLCSCGTKKLVAGTSLRTGVSKSCGCIKYENSGRPRTTSNTEKAIRSIYARYKCDAISRNLVFELTLDEFKVFIDKACFYCGKFEQNFQKEENIIFKYNGIDRANNSIGYILKNCVTCCKHCNTLKNGITKQMIIKLYEFFKNE